MSVRISETEQLRHVAQICAACDAIMEPDGFVAEAFPAITVGLAVLITEERLDTVRLTGLALAVVSVSLIATGTTSAG